MMAPKSGEVLANTLVQNPVNENVSSISIKRFMS